MPDIFTYLDDLDKIAALPDGTLITWLPVHDDPSSEACAYVRKNITDINPGGATPATLTDVWIAPGNGWEPEGLNVLVLPVKVILLGTLAIRADDYIPPLQTLSGAYEIRDAELGTIDFAGGTYPRDVALQAAAAAFAGNQHLSAQLIVNFAETFARWLTGVPVENSLDSGQIDPISFGTADEPYLGHDH